MEKMYLFSKVLIFWVPWFVTFVEVLQMEELNVSVWGLFFCPLTFMLSFALLSVSTMARHWNAFSFSLLANRSMRDFFSWFPVARNHWQIRRVCFGIWHFRYVFTLSLLTCLTNCRYSVRKIMISIHRLLVHVKMILLGILQLLLSVGEPGCLHNLAILWFGWKRGEK